MKQLYEIFRSLNISTNINGYLVADIPNMMNHRIGISDNSYPVFFIKNEKSDKVILEQSLELISIQYNKACLLYNEGMLENEGNYTLIILNSNIPEIQKYFIEIIYIAITKLSSTPTLFEIRNEINKLIELFQNFSRPALKTIQGVWAELLIIAQAKNIDYLVQAWHSSVSSRFDFNDGIDKIEVKCTSKDRRIHRFSLSQLEVTPSSQLLIASIQTQETGIGVSIFDLRERIYKALSNKALITKIDDTLSKTLGQDIQNVNEYYFDYHTAIDYLLYFNGKSIPIISKQYVPQQISAVKFDCDLTNVPTANLEQSPSKLFQSL